MYNEEIQWAMLLSFPFIVTIAYFSARRQASIKFGTEYVDAISSTQWKCAKGLALTTLYCALSFYEGGWEKLLGGVSFSASAFTFFTMTLHEMACGISINHSFNFPKKNIAIISRTIIIFQAISLTSLIFVFQASSVHWAATIAQLFLVSISLVTFYSVTSALNLIRDGYIPLSMRK